MVEVIGPIVLGLIAGALDLFFMVKDESGDAKTVIKHGFGALVYIIPICFFAFNLSYLDGLTFIPAILKNDIILLAALGLITAVIAHTKSALFKGSRGYGSREKWLHCILVGALVGLAPFIWSYIGESIKGLIKF